MSDRKNGYYICYKTNTDFIGVDKKIDDQVKVLNLYCNCQKIAIPREKRNIIKSIMWRMPFGSMGRKYKYALDLMSEGENPDFIYIRFAPLDRRFLKFIKDLRLSYSSAKIILEIPTYPYKWELLRSITMFPFYFKDIYYKGHLGRYVDRIATLTDDKYIFDIPAIKIANGIIVDDIPIIKCQIHQEGINLIAVACFQVYHGYERCIMGMKEYYADKKDKFNIYLHMVGDGPELDKYKGLAHEFGLDKYIFFYGQQNGDDLNRIYDKADIALGSLGYYKIKLEKSSALKVREYLSRGLPIISACQEDVFQSDSQEFYLHVDNDDSAVNMDTIIEFYKRNFIGGMNKEKMVQKIREYARRNVDMSVVMQPVIDYIGEKNNAE